MSGTVENLTVIRPGMVATDYVTAAGQIVAANAGMAASGASVVDAGDQITTSQSRTTRALIDGGAAYDRLRKSLDPTYASAEKFAKATDTITSAVDLHGVSQTEANTLMGLAATRYGQATDASDKLTLSHRQQEFVLHSLTTTTVGAFAAIASGAPIMSVVALEASKLTTELLLSRRGFAIVTENASALIAALGGGWSAAGIAGAVLMTGALVAMGIAAEYTATRIKTMQNVLGATRSDAVAAAAQVEAVTKTLAATTSQAASAMYWRLRTKAAYTGCSWKKTPGRRVCSVRRSRWIPRALKGSRI